MYIYIKRIKFGFMDFSINRNLPLQWLLYFTYLPIILMAETTEYLIITSSTLEEAADSVVALHSNYVDEISQLNTEVILVGNEISATEIRALIQENIQFHDDLKYLLLLGDETILPPIYKDDNPSDDFYTTTNETSGTPQLATGRIPVNNLNDALSVINKIMEYTLNPSPGLWRSKVVLIADDQHKSGSYSETELDHSKNSNILFDTLKDELHPLPYYGTLYTAENGADGLLQPELTMNVLDIINNGVGLINYIGHGSTTKLSDEKIIDMDRDLNRICPSHSDCATEGKLPIWVVGTCSFGQYDGFDTMAEALLKHDAGAIALITTTRSIGANTNFSYLKRLFGKITEFTNGENPHYRLGDLVKEAKSGSGSEYLFHLFGDPALPLPFPKLSTELISPENIPTNFTILAEETIELNTDDESSIIISTLPQEYKLFFDEDSIMVSIPGDVIYQGNTTTQNICFRVPLDAPTCDTCAVNVSLYSHEDGAQLGRIQFINNIPLLENENIIQDGDGPQISISYLGSNINNGITLPPSANLTVQIMDPLGLNLMSGFQHNIRFWFDHSYTSYSVDPQLFQYEESCSNGTATLSLPHNLPMGENVLHIEAWDSANNRSEFQLNINIQQTDIFQAYQVYAMPNPFAETTHFTFWVSGGETAQVTIDIFNPAGVKVKQLQQDCTSGFNSIKWDGHSDVNEDIANGPYIYHLKTKSDGSIFEKLFKVAKLK
ncbi:MAG: hypothetical protein H8E72_09000 [Candidatus Marinimicrobia bacterium]|nr:hypothetical protein [Candidatus Neomarinimicrobiota bacterium]